MVMVGPNNRDEDVANRVANSCRPEQQERLKGWELGWVQFQNQHCDKDGKHTVREHGQSLGGRSSVRYVWHRWPQYCGATVGRSAMTCVVAHTLARISRTRSNRPAVTRDDCRP